MQATKARTKAVELLRLIKKEFTLVMQELGASNTPFEHWSDVPNALIEISKHNTTPTRLIRNIDYATYETRGKIKWNARMFLQLVKNHHDKRH